MMPNATPLMALIWAGSMIAACSQAGAKDEQEATLAAATSAAAQGSTERLTGTDRAVDNTAQAEMDLVAKADRSFSELPFGTEKNDARDLLQIEVTNTVCDRDPGCQWLIASAPHVRHGFDEDGLLVASKHIIIDDYGAGEVRALGIGNAKLKEYVVDAVKAFLPGVELTCLSIEKAGEGAGRSSCGATIGEANVKLIFDEDVLAEVHMYRYAGI